VIFIGLEYVSGLVMAIEAFHNICKNPGPECQHHVEEIWDMSLARGRIAKTIAQQWTPRIDPHLPYVTALLQDIGYVVRICSEPQQFVKYLQLVRSGEKTKYEADAQVFGITHEEVGAALLEYWNFPSEIVQTVASHHKKVADTELARIVQIAEGVAVVDLTNPHDPSLDHQIVNWRQKLTSKSM
jgi:putative nucleotidyltransferase with HDIG domain